MARGKKTGGRNFKPGNPGGKGQPKLPAELKKARALNRIQFETILNKYVHMSGPEINDALRSQTAPILELVVAKILAKAFNEGDPRRTEFILDRLIGRPKEMVDPPLPPDKMPAKRTYSEFVEQAGYPVPFPKQVEMLDFGISRHVPRLLLGARGYGKTDYVTIMGVAYDIYMNAAHTWMIITKDKKRSSAIIAEIAHALKANGVALEKENSQCIRLNGHTGKDHSVDARSIKSGLRGPHPFGIVMDDPVTEEDVSEATRLLVERKYNEAMKLTSNIVILGQPAHAHDLYAKLRPLLVKMEVPYGTIPELDHDLVAMALAGVDERSISMSYHLKIPTDGSAPFEKIKYLDKFPIGDSAVAFIDPSHEGGDYTALSIFRQHLAGIAIEGRCWKRAWNHCLEEMVPHLVRLKVQRVAFETNSLGDQPIIMLGQLLAPHGIGVVGRRSNNNKHSRIMAAGAYAHQLHLSKESDRIYTDQVVQYEYKAKHDDAPDSLATGLEWIGLIRGKT